MPIHYHTLISELNLYRKKLRVCTVHDRANGILDLGGRKFGKNSVVEDVGENCGADALPAGLGNEVVEAVVG